MVKRRYVTTAGFVLINSASPIFYIWSLQVGISRMETCVCNLELSNMTVSPEWLNRLPSNYFWRRLLAQPAKFIKILYTLYWCPICKCSRVMTSNRLRKRMGNAKLLNNRVYFLIKTKSSKFPVPLMLRGLDWECKQFYFNPFSFHCSYCEINKTKL